jgi:predicted transcriptional regulator
MATIKTMLGRLLAKGVLTHEEDGRRYLYRPAVSREDYAAQESTRLIDRLFGGKVTPLVAHLAQRDRLSPRDIAEIEALLKALKP